MSYLVKHSSISKNSSENINLSSFLHENYDKMQAALKDLYKKHVKMKGLPLDISWFIEIVDCLYAVRELEVLLNCFDSEAFLEFFNFIYNNFFRNFFLFLNFSIYAFNTSSDFTFFFEDFKKLEKNFIATNVAILKIFKE